MAVHHKHNHFVVGNEIFQKLGEIFKDKKFGKLSQNVKLLFWADPDLGTMLTNFSPAVVVSYSGDDPMTGENDTAGRGKRGTIAQQWTISIVVQDAATQAIGVNSLDVAGEIMALFLPQLMGLRVDNQTAVLQWQGTQSAFFEDSLRIIPVVFSTELTL